MKRTFRLLLFSITTLFLSSSLYSQECKVCPTPAIIRFFEIELVNIQKPEDPVLLEQYDKLTYLTSEIDSELDNYFENNSNCVKVFRASGANKSESLSEGYHIYGFVVKDSSGYQLKLWLQSICGGKILAESNVRFPLYPEMPLDEIVDKTVSNFAPQIKIQEFEQQERRAKDLPVAHKGNIIVYADEYALKPGMETEVTFILRDCDGYELKNKEITFEGTKGGTFSPAKVTTNVYGVAVAKFRMQSPKGAYIIANSKMKNVKGCDAKFIGSESLTPGLVKVEIEYEEYEEKMVDPHKMNPFAAIKATGGKETEITRMSYNSIFYHKPSAQALKEHYLVFDEKTEIENFGSVSQYWHEYGMASYSKNVVTSVVGVDVAGIRLSDTEVGYSSHCSGNAPERSAEVILFLGDSKQHLPPSFSLGIEFPMSNDCVAGSGIYVSKEKGAKNTWLVNKIKDSKSPFKTEYIIIDLVDLHEEWLEGAKNVGIDFKGSADMHGYRFVKVRILSPY